MTILSLVKRRVQDTGSGTPACGPQAPGDLWPNSSAFAAEDSEKALLYITSQLGQGVVCTLSGKFLGVHSPKILETAEQNESWSHSEASFSYTQPLQRGELSWLALGRFGNWRVLGSADPTRRWAAGQQHRSRAVPQETQTVCPEFFSSQLRLFPVQIYKQENLALE